MQLTFSRKNVLAYLLELGVDGVITDFPHEFLRYLDRAGYKTAPKGDSERIYQCLKKHNQVTDDRLDGWGFVHQS